MISDLLIYIKDFSLLNHDLNLLTKYLYNLYTKCMLGHTFPDKKYHLRCEKYKVTDLILNKIKNIYNLRSKITKCKY